MGLTRGEINTHIEYGCHRDLTNAAHAAQVTMLRNLALSHLDEVEGWRSALSATPATFTMIANTFAYDLPSDCSGRIVADSVSFEDDSALDYVDVIAEIDRTLGWGWKRASDAGGTPRLCCIANEQLVVGPKPSAAFVALHPTLDCWYYRYLDPARMAAGGTAAATKTDTTETLVEPWMLPYVVRLAMIYVLLHNDDNTFSRLLQQFDQVDVPVMRAHQPAARSYRPVKRPTIGLRGRLWGRSRY